MTDLPDAETCTCGHPKSTHGPGPKIATPIFCQGSSTCTCVIFTAATKSTDLPDAVVKLTDDEIKALAEGASGVSPRKRPGDWEYSFPHDALLAAVESIITDRLAAASGPWAEHQRLAEIRLGQIGALRLERDELRAERDALDRAGIREAELDAALARNAELEAERDESEARYVEAVERLESVKALRAELDNLRETRQPDHTFRCASNDSASDCDCAALVRGSDDE